MPVGILTLHLHFPGCASLKEKRSTLKPILFRLHRQLNVSATEMDYHDVWQDALIACACIHNNRIIIEKELRSISRIIEQNFPNVMIQEETYEIL